MATLHSAGATRLVLLLAFVVVTRWPLAPKYLYYFDNINFARALDDFNPVLHQPQPPGYPLFVGFEKLIHAAVPSVKYTQLAAGAVGSAIALAGLWRLGDWMFGSGAGLLAAALLALNPVFWLAGIGNPVRTFLAAGSVTVALCCWRGWFVASSVALGIAAGFRPELGPLLAPLWASTIATRRPRPAVIAAGALALAATSLPWMLATVWACGGWTPMRQAFGPYLGARAGQPWVNAALAIYWTGLGALSWVWALPLIWWRMVWRRLDFRAARDPLLLLAAWFVPPFLFHVLLHGDDPDHLLDCIPAICLAGGWALSRLRWPLAASVALALPLNALLFFAPPFDRGKEPSYRFVKMTGDSTTAAIDDLRAAQPDLVILHDAYVTARQIEYYFPKTSVVTANAETKTVYFPPTARLALLWGDDGSPPLGFVWKKRNFALASPSLPPEFQIGTCRFIRGESPERRRP